jgi:hypothetical protein
MRRDSSLKKKNLSKQSLWENFTKEKRLKKSYPKSLNPQTLFLASTHPFLS